MINKSLLEKYEIKDKENLEEIQRLDEDLANLQIE